MFWNLEPWRPEYLQWAEEALHDFKFEDQDEALIINAIKSNDYKKHAFER